MLVSYVTENQEIGFTKLKGGTESILALRRILADNVIIIMYMLAT